MQRVHCIGSLRCWKAVVALIALLIMAAGCHGHFILTQAAILGGRTTR